MSIHDIDTDLAFDQQLSSTPSTCLLILNFYTPWAAPCVQVTSILSALSTSYSSSSLGIFNINAEALPDISEQYDVSAVPFLVLLRAGKVLETISGSDAERISGAVERHAGKGDSTAAKATTVLPPSQIVNPGTVDDAPATSTSTATEQTTKLPVSLHDRLTSLVSAAPVMLFMKGTPSTPQCGFSRQLVALLRSNGVRYGFFNILADDEVRQGLKAFADWPTYPQLWVGGELAGGLDIVKEEFENDPDYLKDYAVKPSSTTTTNSGGE